MLKLITLIINIIWLRNISYDKSQAKRDNQLTAGDTHTEQPVPDHTDPNQFVVRSIAGTPLSNSHQTVRRFLQIVGQATPFEKLNDQGSQIEIAPPAQLAGRVVPGKRVVIVVVTYGISKICVKIHNSVQMLPDNFKFNFYF